MIPIYEDMAKTPLEERYGCGIMFRQRLSQVGVLCYLPVNSSEVLQNFVRNLTGNTTFQNSVSEGTRTEDETKGYILILTEAEGESIRAFLEMIGERRANRYF